MLKLIRLSFLAVGLLLALPALAQEVPVTDSDTSQLKMEVQPESMFKPEEMDRPPEMRNQPMPGGNGQDQERMKRDMAREAKRMEREFNNIMRMFGKTALSDEMTSKVETFKASLAKLQAASVEELQGFNFGETNELLNDLREEANNQRRLVEIKRDVKGMENALKMFEKQFAKLTKQKIAVPPALEEQLKKVRTMLDAVISAKNWQELEAAGVDDLREEFQNLDQLRRKLEILSRMPQVNKEAKRQISRLEQQLKGSKAMVSSLQKKGIDLADKLAAFEEAIAKLKAVREEVNSKLASGEGEEAMELMEDEFWGQMEEVWQHQRVIDMMSKLGRFTSEFKRRLAEADRGIKVLAKKKVDVSELKELYGQLKAKGEEIMAGLKASERDIDQVEALMMELEDLAVQFENKIDELNGGADNRPWEDIDQPQQFNNVKMERAMKEVSRLMNGNSAVAGIKITK